MAEKVTLWASQPPNIKAAVKKLGLALAVSFGVTIALYIVVHFFAPHGAPFVVEAPRFVAWIDSLLAGIVAFALLGTFAFVASIKRPHDEALDLRVEYLYSSKSAGSEASRKYLKNQVMLLGATASTAHFKYEIIRVDKQQMETSLRVEMTLVNQMSRDSYEQLMPLRVAFNEVDRPDNSVGKILHVQTAGSVQGGGYERWKDHLPHVKVISKENRVYETEIPLRIPPSGSLRYQYLYDSWSDAREPQKAGANRFIDELIVEIHNATDHEVAIERDPECEKKRCRSVAIAEQRTLKQSETARFVFTAVPPTEDISFIQRLIV